MDTSLQTVKLSKFVHEVTVEQIGTENIDQLKRHLLDSLGSLLFATNQPTVKKLIHQLRSISETGNCRVPLLGSLPVDRAAQLFTALIRYPDFMDNYLGKDSTCHPCDNIGSLLAVCQVNKNSGIDFLKAMATAYEVECRLIEEIPIMVEGIDHTLLLSYSIIAGTSQLMSLPQKETAHAFAIAGSSISPIATSRASYTYEWKGFVSSFDAFNCVNITLLAKEGMTGPLALFEGPKGFQEIFNMKLKYDWTKEDFNLISKCILKSYNAEVHSQSVLYAIYELKKQHDINVNEIKSVIITTFLTSYNIIGSGSYGNRKIVQTKEQADHSLHYLAAIALLEKDIYPEQFTPERINKEDVQTLLQKIDVKTVFPIHSLVKLAEVVDPYTAPYPEKMKCKVEIHYTDGKQMVAEQEDYPGFHTRPFTWDQTITKFKRLSSAILSDEKQEQLIKLVSNLENEQMEPLIALLCR